MAYGLPVVRRLLPQDGLLCQLVRFPTSGELFLLRDGTASHFKTTAYIKPFGCPITRSTQGVLYNSRIHDFSLQVTDDLLQ